MFWLESWNSGLDLKCPKLRVFGHSGDFDLIYVLKWNFLPHLDTQLDLNIHSDMQVMVIFTIKPNIMWWLFTYKLLSVLLMACCLYQIAFLGSIMTIYMYIHKIFYGHPKSNIKLNQNTLSSFSSFSGNPQ